MRLIIAIRGNVNDEAEATVIRDAVQAAIDPFVDDDLDLTCEVSVIVKPAVVPP